MFFKNALGKHLKKTRMSCKSKKLAGNACGAKAMEPKGHSFKYANWMSYSRFSLGLGFLKFFEAVKL